MSYRNTIRATAMIAVLAAGLHPLASQAASHSSKVSADGFLQIKVAPGYAQADKFMNTILPFISDHPESASGPQSMSINIEKSGSGFSVNIIKKGYRDDSVMGEHFRGHVIQTSTGKWELLSMEVKYLCYRGKSESGLCS